MALTENTKLGCQGFSGTNTLAHFPGKLAMNLKKCFVPLTPGHWTQVWLQGSHQHRARHRLLDRLLPRGHLLCLHLPGGHQSHEHTLFITDDQD